MDKKSGIFFRHYDKRQTKANHCIVYSLVSTFTYTCVTFILEWWVNIECRLTVAINVSGWLIYLVLSFQTSFTLVCNVTHECTSNKMSLFTLYEDEGVKFLCLKMCINKKMHSKPSHLYVSSLYVLFNSEYDIAIKLKFA